MTAAANPFASTTPGLVGSSGLVVAVTPSDTVDLPGGVCRALLVGAGGAADIIDAFGNARAAVPLQTGYNPIGVQRVKLTSLVASNIWALY